VDALLDMVERAVDDPAALAACRDVVAGAGWLRDDQRERLVGLVDRYEDDLRLEAEAAETALLVAALEDDLPVVLEAWREGDHPRGRAGRWVEKPDEPPSGGGPVRFGDDLDAIAAWGERHFGGWRGALTGNERRKVRDYARDSRERYRRVNEVLRTAQAPPPADSEFGRIAPYVESAVRKGRVGQDVVALRAVPAADLPAAPADLVGATLDWRGFTGAVLAAPALDVYMAERPDPVAFELVVPRGTPAGLVDRLLDVVAGELLLPAGALVRVDSVHGQGEAQRVHATVVGFDTPPALRGLLR
jgi:hypothetical protein